MEQIKSDKGFPRRSIVEEMTIVELMIFHTILEIVNLGADEKLTIAQIKLQEAKDLISDFVESK